MSVPRSHPDLISRTLACLEKAAQDPPPTVSSPSRSVLVTTPQGAISLHRDAAASEGLPRKRVSIQPTHYLYKKWSARGAQTPYHQRDRRARARMISAKALKRMPHFFGRDLPYVGRYPDASLWADHLGRNIKDALRPRPLTIWHRRPTE